MTQSALGPDAASDYIGLLVYASVGGFALLSEDAGHAPSIRDRITLSRMAASELAGIVPAEKIGTASSDDFDELLEGYRDLISDFLLRAIPRDWWERLVRSYVGYHLLHDLLDDLATQAPEWVQALSADGFDPAEHAEWTVTQLEDILANEPQLSARLALWGRRVMGECLILTKRLFIEHPGLVEYAGGNSEGVASLVGRLQANHARRLNRLGLAP